MATTLDEMAPIMGEEIAIDGEIGASLGRCSKSTAYRWRNAINEYYAREKYGFRVKVKYDKDTKTADLIPYNIAKED